jgi:hypothetical protein
MEEPLAQLEFVQDSWLGYRVEDSTAYIRWLFFSGLSSRWCLDCGLVRNSWSVEETLAQLEFVQD